ncbi:hypothetical protein T484DRAFT_2319672 [Baffinella frigidus]|nr:hypothetical protein T484DRAFT_2319672 [Cryptophyta sp. CCMP2293]
MVYLFIFTCPLFIFTCPLATTRRCDSSLNLVHFQMVWGTDEEGRLMPVSTNDKKVDQTEARACAISLDQSSIFKRLPLQTAQTPAWMWCTCRWCGARMRRGA